MFGGNTYQPEHDCKRLTGQLRRVFNLMKDGEWRTLKQIADICRPATEASISARLRDLRKQKFGALDIQHRRDEVVTGLFWYRINIREDNVK